MAYTRGFTQWPAMVESVITYIIDAIYLETVNNAIMEFGMTEFEVAKATTKDEFKREQGIMDDDLLKSLGVFAISIFIILLVMLCYLLIKRFNCCSKIKAILYKKMFYSGPIRYVIVGYLKLLNEFAMQALDPLVTVYMLVYFSGCILFLMLWPIWSAFFLLKNYKKIAN